MLCWHFDNDAKCLMSVRKNYTFYRTAELEGDTRDPADERDPSFGLGHFIHQPHLSNLQFPHYKAGNKVSIFHKIVRIEITLCFSFLVYQM